MTVNKTKRLPKIDGSTHDLQPTKALPRVGSRFLSLGYTLDDILIVPPVKTEVLPQDTDTSIDLGKGLVLKIPVMSAAMENSESSVAIALAREGAVGVINPYLAPEEKVWEVLRVKMWEPNFLANPYVMHPDDTVSEAERFKKEKHIGGIPIVHTQTNRLLGMITEKDLALCKDKGAPLKSVMRKREDLIVRMFDRITVKQGLKLLKEKHLKKLPLVDKHNILRGMIVQRDPDRDVSFPNACVDRKGRLRVGAGINIPKNLDKMIRETRMLLEAGADFLVVDASVGWSTNVAKAVRRLRKAFPKAYLVAGNVVTAQQTLALIEAGVDAVKLFYGPGSTCISRDQLGIGRPNATVIDECAAVARKHGIPLIADGGFEYPGQIVKALALGASVVMTGRMIAGAEEVPLKLQIVDPKSKKIFNVYRGMGSKAALAQRKNKRYNLGVGVKKHIEEGREGLIPQIGSVATVIDEIHDALQRAMAALNARKIYDLWSPDITFQPMSAAGREESRQRIVVETAH